MVEILEDLKVSDAADDTFRTLSSYMATRETSRRTNNNLMKPLSEININAFMPQDHITPSYYCIPDDYP
jgi:hypothetical protein